MVRKADTPKTSDIFDAFIQAGKKQFGNDRSLVASDAAAAREGLRLKHLPLMYLLNSNVLPLGTIMGLAGMSKAMKSSFLYEMYNLFIDAGGFCQYVEAENKFNPVYMQSILGPERMRRIRIDCVESVQEAQDAITAGLEFYKKMCPDRDKPFIIGIDSLAGKATDSVNESIDKEGHAEKAYAEAANLWSVYLKKLCGELIGLPVIFVMTNHLKEKQATGAGAFKPKEWGKQGGTAQDFHASFYLYFTRIENIKRADAEGKMIKISMFKSGYGPDGRCVEIPVLWDFQPNSEGEYIQRTWWDWDAALAKLLVNEKVERPIREAHDIKCQSNRYYSKQLFLEGVTDSDAGQRLHSMPDFVEEIRKRMGAHKWPVLGEKEDTGEPEPPKPKKAKKAEEEVPDAPKAD